MGFHFFIISEKYNNVNKTHTKPILFHRKSGCRRSRFLIPSYLLCYSREEYSSSYFFAEESQEKSRSMPRRTRERHAAGSS